MITLNILLKPREFQKTHRSRWEHVEFEPENRNVWKTDHCHSMYPLPFNVSQLHTTYNWITLPLSCSIATQCIPISDSVCRSCTWLGGFCLPKMLEKDFADLLVCIQKIAATTKMITPYVLIKPTSTKLCNRRESLENLRTNSLTLSHYSVPGQNRRTYTQSASSAAPHLD